QTAAGEVIAPPNARRVTLPAATRTRPELLDAHGPFCQDPFFLYLPSLGPFPRPCRLLRSRRPGAIRQCRRPLSVCGGEGSRQGERVLLRPADSQARRPL